MSSGLNPCFCSQVKRTVRNPSSFLDMTSVFGKVEKGVSEGLHDSDQTSTLSFYSQDCSPTATVCLRPSGLIILNLYPCLFLSPQAAQDSLVSVLPCLLPYIHHLYPPLPRTCLIISPLALLSSLELISIHLII